MAAVRCFLLTPTDRVARWLRRSTSALAVGVRLCEPAGVHEAATRIEDGPLVLGEGGAIGTEPLNWPPEDPRWPKKCRHCDHAFPGLRGGQLLYHRLYRTPEWNLVVTCPAPPPGINAAPVGAMWFSEWQGNRGFQGPDGRCLCLMTPEGEWCIDAPGSDRSTWTRTGTPPDVTVTPSVRFDRWRGKVENGFLIDLD